MNMPAVDSNDNLFDNNTQGGKILDLVIQDILKKVELRKQQILKNKEEANKIMELFKQSIEKKVQIKMEANRVMELFKKGLMKLIFQKLAEREKNLSKDTQRLLELLR